RLGCPANCLIIVMDAILKGQRNNMFFSLSVVKAVLAQGRVECMKNWCANPQFSQSHGGGDCTPTDDFVPGAYSDGKGTNCTVRFCPSAFTDYDDDERTVLAIHEIIHCCGAEKLKGNQFEDPIHGAIQQAAECIGNSCGS
ncbi:MAG: hypothetical protein NT023_25660, partial [Armatimonadetes bacterium]|nr:hypothetical protein [Armatimonadota bacterium]